MESHPKLIFNLAAFENDPDIDKNKNVLSRPKEIGFFSLRSGRIYFPGGSEVKFLVMPEQKFFPLDLNRQSEQSKELWGSDIYAEYLDHMLYFIKDNKDLMLNRISPRRVEVKANIITHSELLQVLKRTIYTKQNWRIFGTKFLGTIYLCLARPSQEDVASATFQIQQYCENYETKLKGFLYSNNPKESEPDDGQLCKVFHIQMGEFSVVYRSPMGAYNQEENSFTDCKVIPTQAFLDADRGISESFFELSWWSECSLNCVEEILVARPNINAHVEAIEKKATASLITKNTKEWSINKCNNSMLHILRQICSNIKVDNPDTIYEFKYDFNSKDLTFKGIFCRNQDTFISDWYRTILKTRLIVKNK